MDCSESSLVHTNIMDHVYIHIYAEGAHIHIYAGNLGNYKTLWAVYKSNQLNKHYKVCYKRNATVGWYLKLELKGGIV